MKLKITLLLILISTFLFSQEKQNLEKLIPIDQKLAYFLKVVDKLQLKAKTPGMAIAIIYDNKIIYKGGIGYRDLENKLPVTNNTLFEIGSLTKAFTGVIASQLVGEKKINWNDNVLKYIPEFKLEDAYATQNATIKDLFTHRVGLDKHYYLIYGPKFSRSELLSKIPYMSFNGSFREKFLYNNFMYTVAGILEERVTRITWEELIKERILKPLEMNHSFTNSKDFLNSKNRTVSYSNDGLTIIPHFSIDTYGPSGSISSTIDDIATWTKMLADSGKLKEKEFLTTKQFNYLTKPITVRYSGSNVFYGIGWNIDTKQNIIYHNGSTAGQRSRLSFNPDKGYGIAILTNQQSDLANALDIYATKIFLENKLERIDEIDTHLEKRSQPKSENTKHTINDENLLTKLKNLEGLYFHSAYGNIEILKIDYNQYSFKYYDFKGTIKHNKSLEFTAFLKHFTGKDQMDFKVVYEKKKIKSIIVNIPYSKPLTFIKN